MDSFTDLLFMLLLFVLVWLSWETVFVYPIKLLTVLFHEAGHALATIATGGKVRGIVINKKLTGLTMTCGGSRLLTLNGGYLSSILIGSTFFYLTYTRLAGDALILMGLLVLFFALLWVRTIFTLVFCVFVSAALISMGTFLTGVIENLVTRLISLCCVLYSFVEIQKYKKMLKYLKNSRTDAERLQSLTRVHALGWAISWSIVAFVVLLVLANLMLTGELFGR